MWVLRSCGQKVQFNKVLNSFLSVREIEILKGRFRNDTYKKIAKEFNISQTRVNQIEKRANEKIYIVYYGFKIKGYLNNQKNNPLIDEKCRKCMELLSTLF